MEVKNIKIKINNKEKNFNLLNDFLFTKIFGERGCEKETLHLINIFTEKNFKTLSYEPTEVKGEHEGHKGVSTDVLVVMNDHTIVNIEAQNYTQKNFHKRSYFYKTRMHSIFLSVGQDHKELPMTILINIIDFNLHNLGRYDLVFIPTEKNQRDYAIDDISETHFIQLPIFRKHIKEGNIDLNNPKDRLMILLNANSPEKLVKKVIEMDNFAKNVHDKIERVMQDRAGYLAYIKADQAERDRKAQIEYAREEGIIEMAKKLKDEGIPLETIAKASELPLSKIEKL